MTQTQRYVNNVMLCDVQCYLSKTIKCDTTVQEAE